jgi:hypothetical protein
MLISYMRVPSDSDRQSTDLQRDALLAAGVDAKHMFEDRASGAKDDRFVFFARRGMRCPVNRGQSKLMRRAPWLIELPSEDSRCEVADGAVATLAVVDDLGDLGAGLGAGGKALVVNAIVNPLLGQRSARYITSSSIPTLHCGKPTWKCA